MCHLYPYNIMLNFYGSFFTLIYEQRYKLVTLGHAST